METITYEKFKKKKIEEYSEENLKKIGESLCFRFNYRKKDLYNKIINRLKLDNEIEKEIIKNKSINPFNKNNNILIIENISLMEKLFWAVFRNKTIFNSIFSNFILKKSCSYDDLIGTEYIFNKFTNAIYIIKDKIISNKYVFRNEHHDIIEIFKNIIKDNQDNRDFYDVLFTKSNINFKDWNIWIESILQSCNLAALKKYIFHFKISPQEIQNTFPVTSFSFNSYLDIKMLFYLKQHYGHVSESFIEPLVRLRFNNYMFGSQVYINILVEPFKLKKLIKIYKYIITLYYNNNNGLNNDTYKYYNLIIETNKITSNHFTKNQLNSTIRDLIIQHKTQASNQQDISHLIGLLHNYYKIIFHISKKYQKKRSKTRKPMDYYYYFKEIDRVKDMLVSEGKTLTLSMVQDFFQVTLSNKQQKIEFINNTRSPKSLGYLANLILSGNDIELKDHYEKNLKPFLNCTYFKQSALESISDTKTLDYFFEKNLYFEDGNENWQYINNKDVLIHYEMLMKQSSKKFRIVYSDNLNIYMFILYRALLYPSIYKFDNCNDLKRNSSLPVTNPYLSALNIIIQKKHDIFENKYYHKNNFLKPTQLIYQISTNISKDLFYNIIKSRISRNFEFILILFLFYCGRIKEGIEYLEQFPTYWDIKFFSQEYNILAILPIKSLEKLIIFFLKKNQVSNFNLLTKIAAKKGYLQIFKKVFSKYGIFLRDENTSQYRDRVGVFISTARSYNNEKLLDFLLKYTGGF
ncbi:hypothetical protein DICPUDRAFT_76039 [Dictyostelium purpureum]|uniref:Uncharacterized protein n=1 Tax=Dictyostelium purpureum TaxID=5786 RepID=F0ZCE7_DICPU|nr:uncharacterized protein DICPUDRAFT_76039 [Dictyostelium purpureum]XP_003293937.1 uncharacterized protein DICPUDRAFT_84449 [Dictyostelium purpureum]EGC29529.1 hypothetical protein DICPUDRAFT_84449 [Dictyostelium purpureum]EGC38409.1 hypothetical protein DICPUDRAFT_76039 [Dictyostelium purpureum]|eukprot:XP_003285070.1 hypothetical protein DICPUDRAFT_76039 [Dictyostelium purpureum]